MSKMWLQETKLGNMGVRTGVKHVEGVLPPKYVDGEETSTTAPAIPRGMAPRCTRRTRR